jgi:hypothetical protein
MFVEMKQRIRADAERFHVEHMARVKTLMKSDASKAAPAGFFNAPRLN